MRLPFAKQPSILNQPIKILLITNSLILISGAMLAPIYALFVKKIGGDLMDASLAGGVFAVVAGITTLISGRFSDKVKENELIIVLGYLIITAAFILYLFCTSIWMLLFIQVLIGLGEAIYSPAFNLIYSKHLNVKRAGAQWGAWESINYFSAAAGAIIGGFIVTIFGFNTLFIIMALLSFFSAIYIYFLPRKVL